MIHTYCGNLKINNLCIGIDVWSLWIMDCTFETFWIHELWWIDGFHHTFQYHIWDNAMDPLSYFIVLVWLLILLKSIKYHGVKLHPFIHYEVNINWELLPQWWWYQCCPEILVQQEEGCTDKNSVTKTFTPPYMKKFLCWCGINKILTWVELS